MVSCGDKGLMECKRDVLRGLDIVLDSFVLPSPTEFPSGKLSTLWKESSGKVGRVAWESPKYFPPPLLFGSTIDREGFTGSAREPMPPQGHESVGLPSLRIPLGLPLLIFWTRRIIDSGSLESLSSGVLARV